MNSGRWLSMSLMLALGLAGAPAASAAGWYVGAGLGHAEFGLEVGDFDDGSISSGRVDDSDTGWKVFAGRQFSGLFAIEGGYVDLNNDFDERTTFSGDSDGAGSRFAAGPASVDIQPTGYFAAAVFGKSLRKDLAIFAKIGLIQWEADATVVDSSGTSASVDDGTNTLWGAGLRFGRRFVGRLEWERFLDVAGTDIELVSVSFEFRL